MPGIMDRSKQLMHELLTTQMFGEEIEEMSPTGRATAIIELLPLLEAAVDLPALQRFNEKARKWIDQHPQP